MMTRRQFIRCGAASAAVAAAAPAWAAGWEVLGRRTVHLGRDRDRIVVTRARGLFRAVRLEVAGAGIFIETLRIGLGNGKSANVDLRHFIDAGKHSRDIVLPGGARVIRNVDLVYRRETGSATAEVTLLGQMA